MADVPALIKDANAKKKRLFGYGHRIYKTVDPRANFIKGMLGKLSAESKRQPLFEIVKKIEAVASKDSYFTSCDLQVNPDL